MLRVLTLSTLFPDASRPDFGGFVGRQTLALAARDDVLVEVVAPIGLPPGPLRHHPRYRALAMLPERETWRGITVHRPRFPILPGIGGPLNPRLMARALLPLLRAIRARFAFDVIDAEFFYPDGPAAARLGAALGVPWSIKARGSDIHFWAQRALSRRQIVRAGRAAGGMLAVSAALKADMVALGLPGEAIRVHHTGVDLAAFRPADDRAAAKAALGVGGPLLVAVGALTERKGHALLIEAVRLLPGATLTIAGAGPYRAALEGKIAAAGLGERVRLLGARPHEALPALFAAADIALLASAAEGLANVWVEALACGTPIVISDVGGAREVVDRPAAGRIAARDPAAIAAAVRELLDDPPAVEAVRAAAMRFTWETNSAALFEHLSAVAKRLPSNRSPWIRE